MHYALKLVIQHGTCMCYQEQLTSRLLHDLLYIAIPMTTLILLLRHWGIRIQL